MEHWLEREKAQWVHPMKDRSDDPSHHERTWWVVRFILHGGPPAPRVVYIDHPTGTAHTIAFVTPVMEHKGSTMRDWSNDPLSHEQMISTTELHLVPKKLMIGGWMDGWVNMNEWMNICMNEWIYKGMDIWRNQWMNEWTNEWTNGWTYEGRKEMFYLTMHSTHFILGYMASDIW